MTAAQARALGRLIRKTRIQRKVSERQLAVILDVGASWLHELEAGKYLNPATGRLALIADILHIEPKWINRITGNSIRHGLPGMYTYLRGKYDLSPADVEKVKRYVQQLQENDG